MVRSRLALLAGLVALAVAATEATSVAGQDSAPPASSEDRGQRLRSRYAQLRDEPGAQAAADALAHARRALSAVEPARRRGDATAAERALAIAEAALTLADRLAARQRARSALEDARRRQRVAEQRAEAARTALERALTARGRGDSPERDAAPARGEPE
jgi:hypothetical protein